MNASRLQSKRLIKVVSSLLLSAGTLGFNTGCLQEWVGDATGIRNFPGLSGTAMNAAGYDSWDDFPLVSAGNSSRTTSTWNYDSVWTETRRHNYQ